MMQGQKSIKCTEIFTLHGAHGCVYTHTDIKGASESPSRLYITRVDQWKLQLRAGTVDTSRWNFSELCFSHLLNERL